MLKTIKKYLDDRKKLKKTVGVLLIIIGLTALVTPFTPGSWLVFVGLELLGFRVLFWGKIKIWLRTLSQKIVLWYNPPRMKKVGKVTHYYDNIGVAIIELEDTLKVGDKVKFEGHGADFEQDVSSMQVNHQQVEEASAGDAVGMKTEQKVREGAEVHKV